MQSKITLENAKKYRVNVFRIIPRIPVYMLVYLQKHRLNNKDAMFARKQHNKGK
jgi:hypothetical protein